MIGNEYVVLSGLKAGERVLLVEAMKTFNDIVAPRAGKVTAIPTPVRRAVSRLPTLAMKPTSDSVQSAAQATCSWFVMGMAKTEREVTSFDYDGGSVPLKSEIEGELERTIGGFRESVVCAQEPGRVSIGITRRCFKTIPAEAGAASVPLSHKESLR